MQPAKQILYISYDGMTDPLGQSQVIPYLKGLTQQGYHFTILSCEKPERFKLYSAQIGNLLSNIGIDWQQIIYTKKPPIISTLYDYHKLKRKAKQLHKKKQFYASHCRSYIPALLGLSLKKEFNIPMIFDMRGFWADERVDGKLWDLKKPLFKIIYKYFKKKEIEFLNESASIVSLTHAAKVEILTWRGIKFNSAKITVIPCCVDTMLFDPAAIDLAKLALIRENFNIRQNEVIIGYLGSIGTWYMLDEMMRFFSELKMQEKNARLLFITPNAENEILQSAAKFNVGRESLIITEAQRSSVPLMISLFNYSLFFIKPAYSKIASSPVKQGEIMAMGIPVICNSGVGDTNRVVSTYQAGVLVDGSNFEKPIKDIINNKIFNSVKIREGAIDYFSLEKGIQSYLAIYNTIVLQ